MTRDGARRRVLVDDVKLVEAAMLAKRGSAFIVFAGHVFVLRCSMPSPYCLVLSQRQAFSKPFCGFGSPDH